MKKRILALALAGTTAFSVFGGAMSANAAWWDDLSSHVNAYDGDYYESLTPSGDLNWSINTSGDDYVELTNTFFYMGSEASYENLDENDEGETIVDASRVVMPPWRNDADAADPGYDGLRNDIHDYDDDDVDGYQYFATFEDLAEDLGYTIYGVGDNTWGEVGNEDYIVAKNADDEYFIFDYEVWDEFYGDGADREGNLTQIYDNSVEEGLLVYKPENDVIPGMPDEGAGTPGGVRVYTADELRNECVNKYGYYLVGENLESADDGEQAFTNMHFVRASDANPVSVFTDNATTNGGLWDEHGRTVTKYNAVEPDFDAVMAEPVIPDGTVYGYDFDFSNNVDFEDFGDAVARGEGAEYLATVEAPAREGVIELDIGYPGHGLREDVLWAWEDFLDEIGLSDHSNKGKTLWADSILSNYAYRYTDDVIVIDFEEHADGSWTITYESGTRVDLYNFEDLIADILELAPADEAANAQTSELVYLMQQYNRYVGEGFVDVNPVETDEWGDLLVALAEAPTEDEFRTSTAYRRYVNKVEDLVEQYEEAETSAAVTLAEVQLYNFVTSYNTAYAVDERASTTNLGTSIDNLYYNYDWRSSDDYEGARDADGDLTVAEGYTDYLMPEFGKAWALYPINDYDGVVGEYVTEYPGVNGTVDGIGGVSAEYGWFYNVYALAYDVYVNNRYQSVVDLMATTLDEAVAALTPTRNASASEVLGAEEGSDELADLVETDYESDMWASRNKIYTFITERVMNDETGSDAAENAEEIAELTARYMGYQKYQTSVTRSEIEDVKEAMGNAQTALTALRNDEENYNAAQANALEDAIANCEYLIDLYDGDYSRNNRYQQSVNGVYNGNVGDKDQLLKSMITDAIEEVDAAINFSNIIQGWSQDKDGNWKYGTEEGYLNDGWHQVDGGKTWFYFEENETAKQSEWWQDPATGTWYWFNSNCGAAVGWAKIDGDWYYFKGNNAMKTGWEKVEGSWYYMNSSGKMVTGWCQINGTWYYFSKESNALGQMLANTTTPDGYKVDANGALVE